MAGQCLLPGDDIYIGHEMEAFIMHEGLLWWLQLQGLVVQYRLLHAHQ